MDGTTMAKDEMHFSIGEDETRLLMNARPVPVETNSMWFLRLRLIENGNVISENEYVEGEKQNDFHALTKIGRSKVEYTTEFSNNGKAWSCKIVLTNNSKIPALMLRLNLKGDDGEQILPVMYSDNYFHLMPSESKVICLSWKDEDSRGCKPVVQVTGFNL